MRVITLGTGAGRPTLRRSSSAVGLEYLGETFLFDCGEGTQIQLMKTSFHWGKMSAIFIGHLHGDHVNGLPGLLGTLSLSDRHSPLTVYGPQGLKKFIQVHQDLQAMTLRFPLELVEITEPGILIKNKRYRVEAFPLKHSVTCWGYTFRESQQPGRFDREKADRMGIPVGPLRAQLVHGEIVTLEDGRTFHSQDFVGPPRPGRSVGYCLDTVPCDAAVQLARGVDLLLYESTFSNSEGDVAHQWGHSTAADAANVAKEAGVGQLILTHISQRYGDVGFLLEEARAIFPDTLVASDLDIFSLDQIKKGVD